MKIIAKNREAYDRKLKEINQLYRAANPQWPTKITSLDPRTREQERARFECESKCYALMVWHKKNLGLASLQDPPGDEELANIAIPPVSEWIIGSYDIKFHPKEFPEGVTLVWAEKCNYCEKFSRPLESTEWRIPTRRHFVMTTERPVTPREVEEVRRLNPGICSDCAYRTYRNRSSLEKNSRNTDPERGRFWGSLKDWFKGLIR